MPRSRATAAMTAQRVNEVYKLILRGAETADIYAYAEKDDGKKKRAWNVSTRQIDTYIRRARVLIVDQAKAERGEQLGLARARLNLLFAQAMSIMDYKTALSVQKEINTLEALHAPPAAQTFKLSTPDSALLADMLREFTALGYNASDVFNAFLAELNAAKEKSSHEH